jgi:type II secretory pathway pseudopilin PulG
MFLYVCIAIVVLVIWWLVRRVRRIRRLARQQRVNDVLQAIEAANRAYQQGLQRYDARGGSAAMMEVLSAAVRHEDSSAHRTLCDIVHMLHRDRQEHPRFEAWLRDAESKLRGVAVAVVERLIDA